MKIKVNSNGYIEGYAIVGSFSDGIDVDDSLLTELSNYANEGKLSFCKYEDGNVVFDEAKFNTWKAKSDKDIANNLLQAKFIPSRSMSRDAMLDMIANNVIKESKESEDNNTIIKLSGYINNWTAGSYDIGDLVNAKSQTWECFQAHDNATYPDINPDNSAWFTFWRPLHATTEETARPFVPVQGAHDMYKVGQYCVYGDNDAIYECIKDTAYSPDEFAAAWKIHDKEK